MLMDEIVLWILYILLFVVAIVLYVIFLKETKMSRIAEEIDLDCDYYRDIPYEYGPEVLGYLLTGENIKTEYLAASIMELIRRKIFVAEEKTDGSLIIRDNDINNLKYMSDSERYLKQWLIYYVGDGVSFDSNELYASLSDDEKRNDFNMYFKEWSKKVTYIGCCEDFFSTSEISRRKYLIFYMICFLAFLAPGEAIDWTMYFYLNFFRGILLVFLVITAIHICNTKCMKYVRTTKGMEHYRKWMGLKKYLLDFASFEDKKVLDVHLWEKYLVYSTVLGITDEINMRLDVNEVGISISEDNEFAVISYTLKKKISDFVLNYKFYKKKINKK